MDSQVSLDSTGEHAVFPLEEDDCSLSAEEEEGELEHVGEGSETTDSFAAVSSSKCWH